MKFYKIIYPAIFLLFAVGYFYTPPCFSQEDEVMKLRQKVSELENRVKELETTLSKYREEKARDESGYNWQNKKNWRKLTTGMKKDEVLALLGEPVKTIEGTKTLWYYPDVYRGYVSFDDKGKLVGWQEP